MQEEAVSFLKEFVNRPQEVGAIVPSSSELAAVVAESIDWRRVRLAVEYGPGLGAITAALVKRLGERDFFAVELSDRYARALRERFPELTVYNDSVKNIEGIVKGHGASQVDAIISSLPWANFSDAHQDELLDATLRVMSSRGQFVTFGYLHGLALRSGRRFKQKLERHFSEVRRSDVVWKSLPPAVVYHCQR